MAQAKAKTEEAKKEKHWETTVKEEFVPEKNTYSIRPYIPYGYKNGGLEKYNMIVADGVKHEEQMALIDYNGNKRYINGLNEFAPEIALLKDEEEKAAKIHEIRVIIARIERERGANVIDPKDKDFWDKVKLCKPDNDAFWGTIKLQVGNEPVFLNPEQNVIDVVKIKAIEAGGFSSISPSLDHAKMSSQNSLWYLDKNYDSVLADTDIKKAKNKALVSLQTMYEQSPEKLFMVAKILDISGHQYKKHTPIDVLYDGLDNFLNGKGEERRIKVAAENFIKTTEMDSADLRINALVKDASFYKYIAYKSDGFIWHIKSNSMMGRNIAECVEYLKNPINERVYSDINHYVEQMWIK